MFSQDKILAMLQAGQDADTIAKQFADALNAAVQTNAAQSKFDEKVAYMDNIIDDLFDFIHAFYPDMDVANARDEIDSADIVRGLDEAYKEVLRLKSMLKSGAPVRKPNIVSKRGSEDAIAAFLQANGLK